MSTFIDLSVTHACVLQAKLTYKLTQLVTRLSRFTIELITVLSAFRSTLRRKSRSTTGSMDQSPKIVSSRCAPSPRDTRSTLSKAKCTKNLRSRCWTSCNSGNVGFRESCSSSTRTPFLCGTSSCWALAFTRGSRCPCPRRI